MYNRSILKSARYRELTHALFQYTSQSPQQNDTCSSLDWGCGSSSYNRVGKEGAGEVFLVHELRWQMPSCLYQMLLVIEGRRTRPTVLEAHDDQNDDRYCQCLRSSLDTLSFGRIERSGTDNHHIYGCHAKEIYPPSLQKGIKAHHKSCWKHH